MENKDFVEKETEQVETTNEAPVEETVSETEEPAEEIKEKRRFFPQIHLTKRDGVSLKEAIFVRVIGIVAALIVCAVLTVILTGYNPIEVYVTICKGAFGKGRGFDTIHAIAILLCVSLAVTPAFRMHFWNIGAEGQTLIGGLATAFVMFRYHNAVSTPVLVLMMLAAAIIAGGVWGLIPAVFKAQWNTNETLFTLMMNYVAMQIVSFFCVVWENPKGSGQMGVINQKTHFGWVPDLGNRYLLVIVVVCLLTVLMYFYLNYTKHGFELTVVGESERTARYVGIKVSRVVVRTMLLSGLVCGLTGFLLVGSINHNVSPQIAGGQGFTAVMVSWLAKFNPVLMILFSGLIIFLGAGANELATSIGLNKSFGDMLTGILIFCIIGCEFFINYKINFRKSEGKEAR